MQSERQSKRNVIPRWRPLAAIDHNDLININTDSSIQKGILSKKFGEYVDKWKSEGGIGAANDLLDLFILTQDPRIIEIVLNKIKRSGDVIPERMRDTVALLLKKPENPLDLRRRSAFVEKDVKFVHRSISILKQRLVDFPQNTFSHLEIARLYTVAGAFAKAEKHLVLARSLSPENRVILRASLQFYDVVESLEEGLKVIRRAERIRYDPWIQSAEIAASTILGKESRVASRRLVSSLKDGTIPREKTELAMALATLEREHGVRDRKIFEMVGHALPHATENGFAQAIWLSEQSKKLFAARYPGIEPASEAYEAHLRLAIERFDFESAAGFAELWLEDQPFNASAIINYLNLRAIHIPPDDQSVSWATRAAEVHGDNWSVLNAVVLLFAEAKKIELANHAFGLLNKAAPTGLPRAYVAAAKGFLAFSIGDFYDGRCAYQEAIEICRNHNQSGLLVNAYLFWLRCEANNKLLSIMHINTISEIIDRSIRRLDPSDRVYLMDVWHSIRSIIEHNEQYPEESASTLFIGSVTDDLDTVKVTDAITAS